MAKLRNLAADIVKFGNSGKSLLLVLFVVGIVILTSLAIDPFKFSAEGHTGVRQVYFVDNISPAHQAVIDRFNALHRGRIEVVPVNVPFGKFSTNERKELLARSLRERGDLIDVFAVDEIWVPRFSRWGEPLEQLIPAQVRSSILPQALQSCVFESVLVAVPFYIDVGLMFYNRDALKGLPDSASIESRIRNSISWEELLQLRDHLGFARRPYFVFQADDYEGLVCNYVEMLADYNKRLFEDGKLQLTTPEARKALQRLVDFVHRDKISPTQVSYFKENESYQFVVDSGAMFLRGWSPNFIKDFGIPAGRNYDIAPLPHNTGSASNAVLGGWDLMIARSSTKKAEALEFIQFVLSEEAQKIMFEQEGYIPILESLYTNPPALPAYQFLPYYRTMLNNGFQRPALVDYTRISDVVAHYVHLAIKGEMPVDSALAEATAAIGSNKLLMK